MAPPVSPNSTACADASHLSRFHFLGNGSLVSLLKSTLPLIGFTEALPSLSTWLVGAFGKSNPSDTSEVQLEALDTLACHMCVLLQGCYSHTSVCVIVQSDYITLCLVRAKYLFQGQEPWEIMIIVRLKKFCSGTFLFKDTPLDNSLCRQPFTACLTHFWSLHHLSAYAGHNPSCDAVLQGEGASQGQDPFPHPHTTAAAQIHRW